MDAADVTAEQAVSMRITFRDTRRRTKFLMGDMRRFALEEKVRQFLEIGDDEDVLLERYSDSGAAYVQLNNNDVSVYKQLYRAAKAKKKLKLRVTATAREVEEVEEEAEEEPELEPHISQAAVEPLVDIEQSPHESIREVCAEARQYDPEDEDVLPMGDEHNTRHEWTICCNNCRAAIPDEHYHCATCDDDNFDLCGECVRNGRTCYSPSHWLIKRFRHDGAFVSSVTERLPPKPPVLRQQVPQAEVKNTVPETQAPIAPAVAPGTSVPEPFDVSTPFTLPYRQAVPHVAMRCTRRVPALTCNVCLKDFGEEGCVHCAECPDYDICHNCFAAGRHGHDPSHRFEAASGTNGTLPQHVRSKLAPGRNRVHHAVCDGCETAIYGVRHKCLDCPDWDYCANCIDMRNVTHPRHRFAPIYEPLALPAAALVQTRPVVHPGVRCDGPLCKKSRHLLIAGPRYKCAICNDTDFCSACEASPLNTHNASHPLIKLSLPVQSMAVTAYHDYEAPAASVSVSVPEPTPVPVPAAPAPSAAEVAMSLSATFVRDGIPDGTMMLPGTVFEQIWELKNCGTLPWPAGTLIKYAGGEFMGNIDHSRPSAVERIAAASESSATKTEILPGEVASFRVTLRSPLRPGKAISYWRLTSPEGFRFGQRVWCDILVVEPAKPVEPIVQETVPADVVAEVASESEEETFQDSAETQPRATPESPSTLTTVVVEEEEVIMLDENSTASSSQMIFPTISETTTSSAPPPAPARAAAPLSSDWEDDGFFTDEEYDILDASDEEIVRSI